MHSQIAVWGKLAGINHATDKGDLIGLFHQFRPNGVGVESVFAGQPLGEQVLARVRKCYDCTRSGFRDSDPYFTPRPTATTNISEAQSLLRRHIMEMQVIAGRLRNAEILERLSRASLIQVASRANSSPMRNSDDSTDTRLVDMITDFMCTLTPRDSPLFLLSDAFYSIACDTYVQAYLEWPLCAESEEYGDPFLPAFELWSKGVSFSFDGRGSCRFVVHSN